MCVCLRDIDGCVCFALLIPLLFLDPRFACPSLLLTPSQVDWAHPEFGQILVSCGDDSTAQIWEEQAGSTSANRWVKKASLTDARKPVNAVALAPRHLGLRLATGGADGIVRVYEAVDVLNLESWPLSQRFDADVGSEVGVTSLSWCSARFDPPSLVVGGSSGAVKVRRGYYYRDVSSWSQLSYALL